MYNEKMGKEQNNPKSNKYGDVRKCPNCGAVVPAFKGTCPECDYEFVNIEANLSSKLLSDKLLNEWKEEKKIEIIETFPIPNSKADLLEFLTALKPRVEGSRNQLTDAYFKKYKECLEKAKISFNGDSQLKYFIDDFPKLEKRVATQKNRKLIIISKVLIVLGVIAIVVLGGILIRQSIKTKRMEKLYVTLQQEQCDLLNAKKILKDCTESYRNWENRDEFDRLADNLIELCLKQNNIAEAKNVYSEFSTTKRGKLLMSKWHMEKGEYDEAWAYYPGPPYGGKTGKEYYSFMNDVISSLCNQNKKDDARVFVNKYSLWFKQNVDSKKNSDIYSEKEEYKNFNYQKMKKELLETINQY